MLSELEQLRLARLVRRACGGQMAFLLTCNRVEVYAWADIAARASVRARLGHLAARLDPHRGERYLARAQLQTDEAAALHLLRVAAGLESQIEGDAQVLGQMRSAYALASGSGSLGPELHRLFQTALRAGKRVRAETGFGRRASSVGAAAALQLGDMNRRRVIILGAGKTAECAAGELIKGGAKVTIVNRTGERAAALAQRLGAGTGRFEERHDLIALASAVIVATGAPEPTLRSRDLEAARARAGRHDAALWIIDLAMPRNVESSVSASPGVRLTGLEAVGSGDAGPASHHRQAAERIVEEEVRSFMDWLERRAIRHKIVA
jgi:glutamyl-tRNA reductase